MSGHKENIQHAYIFKAVLKTLKGALCFEPVKFRVPSSSFFFIFKSRFFWLSRSKSYVPGATGCYKSTALIVSLQNGILWTLIPLWRLVVTVTTIKNTGTGHVFSSRGEYKGKTSYKSK